MPRRRRSHNFVDQARSVMLEAFDVRRSDGQGYRGRSVPQDMADVGLALPDTPLSSTTGGPRRR